MWNTVAVTQVSAANDADNERRGMRSRRIDKCLREGPVPEQLRFDEVLEFRIAGFTVLMK